MLQLRNLLSGRALLYAALALVAVLVLASALLTTCDTRSPAELSRRQERHVTARRDSALARASRLDHLAQRATAHAAVAYDSARIYQDSATYFHAHESDIIYVAPADSARVQRFLADYFDL